MGFSPQHVIRVERTETVVCLAEADDRQRADGSDEDDQNAEAEQQPGSCVEILKPVHG